MRIALAERRSVRDAGTGSISLRATFFAGCAKEEFDKRREAMLREDL
jgi:hypothetical protein